MTHIRCNTSARHYRNFRRAKYQTKAVACENAAIIYTAYNILDFIL